MVTPRTCYKRQHVLLGEGQNFWLHQYSGFDHRVVPSRRLAATATWGWKRGRSFSLMVYVTGRGETDPHHSFNRTLLFALQMRKNYRNFPLRYWKAARNSSFCRLVWGRSRILQDSSVNTATRYRLDGPWIESRWKSDFPHQSSSTLGPTQASYTMGTVSLSRW
jgi:hypothetical protein